MFYLKFSLIFLHIHLNATLIVWKNVFFNTEINFAQYNSFKIIEKKGGGIETDKPTCAKFRALYAPCKSHIPLLDTHNNASIYT